MLSLLVGTISTFIVAAMKWKLAAVWFAWFSGAAVWAGDVHSDIIVGPNSYYFLNSVYYAAPGATSATITVGMNPGSPAWTGSVGYRTQDGTAIAGQDYTAVSGSVSFWGPAWKTFEVPIKPARLPQDKTVTLLLQPTDSSGQITRGGATLVIQGAPTPTLEGRRLGTNTLRLSWPTAYTNYQVEIRTPAGPGPGEWSLSPTPPTRTNDDYFVDLKVQGPLQYFRLRQIN